MKKIVVISLVVIFFVGILFLVKSKNILAQDDGNSSGIESKLDKILQNQEAILNKLSAMSEELNIIRVRASRR